MMSQQLLSNVQTITGTKNFLCHKLRLRNGVLQLESKFSRNFEFTCTSEQSWVGVWDVVWSCFVILAACDPVYFCLFVKFLLPRYWNMSADRPVSPTVFHNHAFQSLLFSIFLCVITIFYVVRSSEYVLLKMFYLTVKFVCVRGLFGK
jgi:hypothetical protein